MRRSDSIFDSRAERAVFESLDSRFGGAGRLVPQLPLSKLIELDGQDVLTAAEVGFFYKTNVDFTFADEDGRPLFSIEFDGIGGGYSRAGIYVPQRPTGDPRREWKFDFKLRLAREVGYPLLILSFDEAGPLADGESLTVLDGIVGHLLANTKAPEIIRERLAEGQHELDQYDDDLRFEMAQDLVWGAEIEAELEYDPLSRGLSELQGEFDCHGFGTKWLYDPPIADLEFGIASLPTPSQIERRARLIKLANRVGAEAEVWSHSQDRRTRETVWIRNVAGDLGTMEIIAERVALYRAFRRLRDQLGKAPAAA